MKSLKNRACVQQRQFIIIAQINQLNNANNDDVISICSTKGIFFQFPTKSSTVSTNESMNLLRCEYLVGDFFFGQFLLVQRISERTKCVNAFCFVKIGHCHTESMERSFELRFVVAASLEVGYTISTTKPIVFKRSLFCFKLPLTHNLGPNK